MEAWTPNRLMAQVAEFMAEQNLPYKWDPVQMMTDAGMPPDDKQIEALRSKSFRIITLCHRQWGKSTVAAVKALHHAMSKSRQLVLMLSPSLRQSSELFRKTIDAYGRLPNPPSLKQQSALRLELENQSRIISLPGQEATIRGFSGVNLLIVDEASRVPDELYYAIRPMLLVSKGQLMVMSTPFGKRGWFYEAWENGSDDWHRIAIRADENKRIDQAFIEEERMVMPRLWFDQEYTNKFVDTVEQIFTDAMIQNMMSQEVDPLFGEPQLTGADRLVSSSIVPLFKGEVLRG